MTVSKYYKTWNLGPAQDCFSVELIPVLGNLEKKVNCSAALSKNAVSANIKHSRYVLFPISGQSYPMATGCIVHYD